ncbi:hypothetical protein F2P56_006654 [Juglans regia]|uniref:Uncharacterized protein n=2 Tax=Juglans regia TaxID=51240 RepID=A0A834D262_JUGRE|nr:uncharacterized protein LOC108982884 [Juglans regia]KAF5474790.1 hypothetical protein F2P56_006654 [Juglans regia]
MNFTGVPHSSSATPHRRKPNRPSLALYSLRRKDVPPQTPLSQWKFFDEGKLAFVSSGGGNFWRSRVEVSARKLSAGLWKFWFAEVSSGTGGLVCGPCDVVGSQLESTSLNHEYSSMEGGAKRDPRCSGVSNEVYKFYGHTKHPDDQSDASRCVASALQAELVRARSRIRELEAEERSSKKKVGHLLRKLEEERISWQSREQTRNRTVVDGLKDELVRHRKSYHMMESLNSKLVNEVANAKLSAKQIVQKYEEEKRVRELMVEVCNELVKLIVEHKAQVEELKKESRKIREEVEEERQMLKMAEILREEQIQMKLVDAKLAFEDRYSEMNKLINDVQTFLRSRGSTPDAKPKALRKAKSIQHAVKSMNIQDIKEFSIVPTKPENMYSNHSDLREGEADEGGIASSSKIPTSSPNNIASVNTETECVETTEQRSVNTEIREICWPSAEQSKKNARLSKDESSGRIMVEECNGKLKWGCFK